MLTNYRTTGLKRKINLNFKLVSFSIKIFQNVPPMSTQVWKSSIKGCVKYATQTLIQIYAKLTLFLVGTNSVQRIGKIGWSKQWITDSRSAWRQPAHNTCVTLPSLTLCTWSIWKATICAHITSGSASHTLTTIRMSDGVPILDAITALSIKSTVSVMFSVSVETHSVSNAVKNLTVRAHANRQLNGKQRILTRVKTLPGLWQIRNNVLSARSPSRRIKAATIWPAGYAVTNSAGCVSETGKSTARRLEATTSATSTRSWRSQGIPRSTRRNRGYRMLKMNSINTCSTSKDSTTTTRLRNTPEVSVLWSKPKSTFFMTSRSTRWRNLNSLRKLSTRSSDADKFSNTPMYSDTI